MRRKNTSRLRAVFVQADASQEVGRIKDNDKDHPPKPFNRPSRLRLISHSDLETGPAEVLPCRSRCAWVDTACVDARPGPTRLPLCGERRLRSGTGSPATPLLQKVFLQRSASARRACPRIATEGRTRSARHGWIASQQKSARRNDHVEFRDVEPGRRKPRSSTWHVKILLVVAGFTSVEPHGAACDGADRVIVFPT
jgi:hypothetical protein